MIRCIQISDSVTVQGEAVPVLNKLFPGCYEDTGLVKITVNGREYTGKPISDRGRDEQGQR